MKNLKIRASLFGWSAPDGILNVAPSSDHLNRKKQMLENYGVFSYERIVEHEKSYIFEDTRASQDNIIFYTCLMYSLSMSGRAKLTIHDSQYMIGTPPT